MDNTLFVGKVCHHFDELPSTNDYALNLIAKSRPPEGTIVIAANQTAGRGQFGSTWVVEPGQNLTLSVILYPAWLGIAHQFRLLETTALAVRDTVAHCLSLSSSASHHAVTIKWPNDVYIGDQKTAGILIQSNIASGRIAASVIGIGINVNQSHFPPSLNRATSLCLETGNKLSLSSVAQSLYSCLETRYLHLRASTHLQPHPEYLDHLYKKGVRAKFERADSKKFFYGEIAGVTPEGRLIIGEESFDLKTVKFVFE